MCEENESVDILQVYSDSKSEKDLIQRRNKIKSHTAQPKNYRNDFQERYPECH